MFRNRKWILVISTIGIMAAILIMIIGGRERSKMLIETGETRASVELFMQRLLPEAANSADDQRLVAAVTGLEGEPYVASAWIVDWTGQIVLHLKGPGRQGENVKDIARGDMARVLEAVDEGTFSESQKLQLFTIGAMRSEGEHNDVFRHLVRPIFNQSGETVALVALAYDVSPYVQYPGMSTVILTVVSVLGIIVYWLGLPLWALFDSRARGESAILWGFFVLITNLAGLIAYLIVISRQKEQIS
ncbi:MAG: hypothetical protein M1371_01135 [Actinobacteria bacterium]|nr:hypothetical protein [Actinomycetota bacterium]